MVRSTGFLTVLDRHSLDAHDAAVDVAAAQRVDDLSRLGGGPKHRPRQPVEHTQTQHNRIRHGRAHGDAVGHVDDPLAGGAHMPVTVDLAVGNGANSREEHPQQVLVNLRCQPAHFERAGVLEWHDHRRAWPQRLQVLDRRLLMLRGVGWIQLRGGRGDRRGCRGRGCRRRRSPWCGGGRVGHVRRRV